MTQSSTAIAQIRGFDNHEIMRKEAHLCFTERKEAGRYEAYRTTSICHNHNLAVAAAEDLRCLTSSVAPSGRKCEAGQSTTKIALPPH